MLRNPVFFEAVFHEFQRCQDKIEAIKQENELLITKGVDRTLLEAPKGKPPLIHWVKKNNLNNVKILLESGANVNRTLPDKSTALHVAAKKGYVDIGNELINNRANVNAADEKQTTPLQLAAKEGHVEFVKLLLAKNAFTFPVDSEGHTALDIAREKGFEEIKNLIMDDNKISINPKP